MKKEELGPLGAWSLGLLLVIATVIIIRWVVDFITWSALDSGWAQAIGSVAALGVAIFVMSKQNEHAARLILETDKLALRRKASAVRAILEHVYKQIGTTTTILVSRHTTDDVGVRLRRLKMVQPRIRDLERSVLAIPAYELGSYHLAKAVHQFSEILLQYSADIDGLIEDPADTTGIKTMQLNIRYSLLKGPLWRLNLGIDQIDNPSIPADDTPLSNND